MCIFVVLFFIFYGGYFLMRVRSREHLGGEFDSILTCVSRWPVAVRWLGELIDHCW